MTDSTTARAAAELFHKLDDGLYDLREKQASHQEQEAWGVEVIEHALQQARLDGLREAAQYLVEANILTSPDELEPICKFRCFAVIDRIAAYFRQQAKGPS